MRRLRRILFALVSAVSLLLCFIAVCMWAQLLHGRGALRCGRGNTEYIVRLQCDAGIMLQRMAWKRPLSTVYRTTSLPLIRTGVVNFTFCPGGRTSDKKLIGFEIIRRENCAPDGSVAMFEHRVIIPFWAAALLAAIAPFFQFIALAGAYRRCCRLKHNLCGVCGYDLRASKDRCPECGSSIPQITNNK